MVLSVDRQLAVLEQQYLAVINGSKVEIDGSRMFNYSSLEEMKKLPSDLLSKPIDVVGDDKPQEKKKKKKSGQKKKDEPKKQWTREQILSTFLPPEKQVKGRKVVPKQKEKKQFPQAVMKSAEEQQPDALEDIGSSTYNLVTNREE